MNGTFLDKILENTRERVGALKASVDVAELRSRADEVRSARSSNRFRLALEEKGRTNIIAEIKRASPSKGVINDQIDVAATARAYRDGGAAAISVLTEKRYFKGSIADLEAARRTVDLPILRKDFIVDAFQVYEAAAAGADAVLLIVAALTSEDLKDLQTLARDLGLDALVEVHTRLELEVAQTVGANVIGVNNRDLRTFDVSLDVSRELIRHKPEGSVMIAESGISSRHQIEELKSLGFDGFLVGEALMRASGRQMALDALI
jgi:indole-3-glycerol phosphate synthase